MRPHGACGALRAAWTGVAAWSRVGTSGVMAGEGLGNGGVGKNLEGKAGEWLWVASYAAGARAPPAPAADARRGAAGGSGGGAHRADGRGGAARAGAAPPRAASPGVCRGLKRRARGVNQEAAAKTLRGEVRASARLQLAESPLKRYRSASRRQTSPHEQDLRMASDRSGRQGGTREHSRYTRCWQRWPVCTLSRMAQPVRRPHCSLCCPTMPPQAGPPSRRRRIAEQALDIGARGTPLRLPHGEGSHAYRDATARPG